MKTWIFFESFHDVEAIPTTWETVSANEMKWLQVSKAGGVITISI